MSDQSPFEPPRSTPFGAPSGPPTEPMPVSPVAPKSNPWKPAALGFGAAAVVGAGVFGIVQLTGDDDEPSAAATISVATPTVPAELGEQIDAADDQVADVDGSLPVTIPELPGVPGLPGGSAAPSSALPDSDADAPTMISIPGMALDEVAECLGLGDLLGGLDLDQLGELGELGTLPTGSLPDFTELTPEELAELDVDELLEQMFSEMGAGLPGGSLPFDPGMFDQLDLGELGDLAELTPEQLQELIESQVATLGSLPTMSLPPVSIAGVAPLDPAHVEECLADLAG